MAINLSKLALRRSFAPIPRLISLLLTVIISLYARSTKHHLWEAPLGLDGANINHQEFQKWHNGGGMFHKTACIESTTLIEIGAVVHSECVVAANVHIGSGTIVGPAVKIGESTKIEYNVSVTNCTIGDACFIHNGVCIGQDGKAGYQT
ncbi:putative UDP-3-O-acylglucosamine N-acyltransferase 2, mitochondrial [Vitis vinifera]|uniref:Putative UDP-3-O-acylglucosamine N-acyltransferase 2, mitochondrial n=1 Tax=Vitis vinifera TaxID=29760 RepID=A0A438EEP6_VITVI|nr:putative UDP-3-O-acylglucosamine N-acyltransferase 2, mitochondrial [Vitis vinifera]